MAQKKDKDRKQNLVNYKTKIKKQMDEQKTQQQLQNMPQISQYPSWASGETIEVNGLEWESILNVLNVFRPAIVATESIMQRNIASGKIVMKYVDAQGNEVAQEKVDEYKKQLESLFAARRAEQSGETESPILSETGEKVKKSKKVETEDVPQTDPSAALRSV